MRCWDTRRLIQIKLFYTQTTFSSTLSDIQALWKLKQTRDLADNKLFGGLRVKTFSLKNSNTFENQHLYRYLQTDKHMRYHDVACISISTHGGKLWWGSALLSKELSTFSVLKCDKLLLHHSNNRGQKIPRLLVLCGTFSSLSILQGMRFFLPVI